MVTIKGKYKFVDKPTPPTSNVYIDTTLSVYIGSGLCYGFVAYPDSGFYPEPDATYGIHEWLGSGIGSVIYDFETETWTDEKDKIVDFTEETTLTDVENEWFEANLKPYTEAPTNAVTIEYNNAVIASLKAGQSASLPCKDKPMLTDVVVTVPEGMGAGEVVEEWNGSIEVV